MDWDWFTGKNSSAQSWVNDQYKKREDRQYQAAELKKKKKEDEEKAQKKKEDEKNFFQKTAEGVGNFVKDAAVDVKDTAVGAYTGVKDVLEGGAAVNRQKAIADEKLKLSRDNLQKLEDAMGDDFDNPDSDKWDSDEIKALVAENNKKMQDFDARNKTETNKNKKEFKESQKVDSTKTAFQAAETFLNVATLGVGTGGKQLVKQGGKQIVKRYVTKEAFKAAVKTGGAAAVEQIIKNGGERTIKRAAQEVLEEGAQKVLQSGGKKLAGNMAKDASIGAAYGVTQTGKNQDEDTQLDDYLLNVAFGAGIGAAVPLVGAGLKKGVTATKDKLKGTGKPVTAPLTGKADDANRILNNAIEEQSEKYGTNTWQRVKNWVGDQIDPFRAGAKIDDAWAKANGVKRNKVNSEDSIEDLLRRSAASEREAASLFEKKLSSGRSASDLVRKYKGDSDAGKEFNNYTNLKFLQEIRGKKSNYQLPAGLDDETVARFIDDYEFRNPDAVKDLALKKEVNDLAVDYMADSGAISRAEANQIKKAYKNAVPLEKVFPDDLERPQVTGKNLGSIGKQTVIQRLEEGSEVPLSNSFDTMLNRVYKSVGQGNRAKVAAKILERAEQGLIPDAKLAVTAGNKEARQAIREDAALVTKGIKYLQGKVKVSNRQMRRIESELNAFNKEGMNISLKDGGQTPLPNMAVDSLSKLKNQPGGKSNSSRQFFKSLVEANPKELDIIKKKIATREPKLAAKIDEIVNHKQQIDSLKAARSDMKEVVADFVDDPTTGKQLISGLVDGQQFKLEVPPDLAKALMGLDQQKLPSVLKALAIAKKPFEVAWTGILNPVFSGISFAFYDTPMSIINSPQGLRTMGPKAVVESLKSIRSSSEFQRRLAAEGARPYGGSGASSFVKPDAKSIASTRNILSNIGYTTTHPETALSKLDIFGGKLANMTRTRVARAAYDDAIRIAKREGEDVMSPEIQKRAMENAALAYRTIMPDFDTMSNLTRQINAVVPFYAASTAGTRAFGKAMKRDPLGTGTKALALGIAPTIGVTAYSLASPQGQAFYDEMERTNPKLLDDNMVVVLPGAHKNEETGKWEGIIKVPLAPEFRALNQSVWRETRSMLGKGDGPSMSQRAWSLFDTVTGGVRTSQNPLIDTVKILAGEDPRTGKDIIKGDMRNLPKNEQVYESSSNAGKWLAERMGTSPIQADKILGQFGIVGSAVKNEDATEAIGSNIENRFTGAFGETATRQFYDTYTPIRARRDKLSKEVTSLVRQGKRNEARRKAEEFNETLTGSFGDFFEEYGRDSTYNPAWDEMMSSLYIRTGKDNFDARARD